MLTSSKVISFLFYIIITRIDVMLLYCGICDTCTIVCYYNSQYYIVHLFCAAICKDKN